MDSSHPLHAQLLEALDPKAYQTRPYCTVALVYLRDHSLLESPPVGQSRIRLRHNKKQLI